MVISILILLYNVMSLKQVFIQYVVTHVVTWKVQIVQLIILDFH